MVVLAGNGNVEFTPLLESWLNPKTQRLLHDPRTKEFVRIPGDRKNRKTRKIPKNEDFSWNR